MINLDLKKIMDEKGLTITDLHLASGISRSSLTPIINKPDEVKSIKFEVLDKICETLNVNLEDFLTYQSSALFEIQSIEPLEIPDGFSSRNEDRHYICKFNFASVRPEFESYLLIEEDKRIPYDPETIEDLRMQGYLPVPYLTLSVGVPNYFEIKPFINNLSDKDKSNLDYMTEYISKADSHTLEKLSRDILNFMVSDKLIQNEDELTIEVNSTPGLPFHYFAAYVSAIDYDKNTFDFNVIK